METLDELLAWLHGATTGCGCGIFDATNTTAERRRAVAERCARESPHVTLLFVETICDDDEILTLNYRMKLVNDDYRGVDPAKALTDFKERVAKYEAVYQPLDDGEAAVADHDAAFIKMVNAGRKLVVSHSQSRVVASKVLGLLPRSTWARARSGSRWSARPPTTARACSATTRRSRRKASSTRAPSPPTSASASASCATRRRATRRGTGRRAGRRGTVTPTIRRWCSAARCGGTRRPRRF